MASTFKCILVRSYSYNKKFKTEKVWLKKTNLNTKHLSCPSKIVYLFEVCDCQGRGEQTIDEPERHFMVAGIFFLF